MAYRIKSVWNGLEARLTLPALAQWLAGRAADEKAKMDKAHAHFSRGMHDGRNQILQEMADLFGPAEIVMEPVGSERDRVLAALAEAHSLLDGATMETHNEAIIKQLTALMHSIRFTRREVEKQMPE